MCRGFWLLARVLLVVVMLGASRTTGFQTPSSQPAVTPRDELASSSNQRAPTPSYRSNQPVSPAAPSATPVRDRETIVRLKIFLDQHSFGPGEIDDRWSDL